MVMREWAWAYFTRERSARLITGYADSGSLKPLEPEIVAAPLREKKEV
jgi:hypothetical protein